jgi:hypothetical protein
MANIEFSNTTPATVPTLSGTKYPLLVTDCEHPDGSTTWNTYWFWWADSCPNGSNCVAAANDPYNCTGTGGLSNTSVTYPVYTVGGPTSAVLPFQANTSPNAVNSSCVAGHMAGNQGDGGSAICGGNYSSCGFGFNLYPATATNQYVNLSPSGLNFNGIKFKAMNGSTATGQMYIVIPKASITDSSDFRYIIGSGYATTNGGSDPTLTTSWQQYKLPFTTFGCPAVEGNSGWGSNQCSTLAAGNPTINYMIVSQATDIQAVKFQPVNQNEQFDLWIDDVEFY